MNIQKVVFAFEDWTHEDGLRSDMLQAFPLSISGPGQFELMVEVEGEALMLHLYRIGDLATDGSDPFPPR